MTIFVLSTDDHSVVCDDARFVFVGTLKKAATNPASKFSSHDKPIFGAGKFLSNLQLVNFVVKFFSNQSFRCVCKIF